MTKYLQGFSESTKVGLIRVLYKELAWTERGLTVSLLCCNDFEVLSALRANNDKA